MRETLSRILRPGAFWCTLLAVLVFFALPAIWMGVTAFKPPADYVSATPCFFPSSWTLDHIKELLRAGFVIRFFNTAWVAAGATLVSVILGFMAAYSLVRFKFPARLDLVFLGLVLGVKLMPPIVVALPIYTLLSHLHLLDTLWGLILSYQLYTLPFSIWMLIGYVRDVPLEIEEAAIMDDTSLFQRLTRVVLPLCGPGIAATAIFVLILCWNEFLFALLFLQQPDHFTLPLYIANFITENETFWGNLMGIGMLSSAPVLIFAGFIQRYLVRGFSMGMK